MKIFLVLLSTIALAKEGLSLETNDVSSFLMITSWNHGAERASAPVLKAEQVDALDQETERNAKEDEIHKASAPLDHQIVPLHQSNSRNDKDQQKT